VEKSALVEHVIKKIINVLRGMTQRSYVKRVNVFEEKLEGGMGE
jgi:hypothetical protein